MLPNLPQSPTTGSQYQISDLDDVLNRLGESLQLDATRRQLAESRYKAVADWIEKDEIFFKNALIKVYPQGSFRIRTTVKPYKQSEFDLDFVVHLDFLTGKNYDALHVLNQLERRLKEHETYKLMMQRKNRCIRITYANDFHMDILVGCQEMYFEEKSIIVPDRKTKDWTPSNPIGYADWFLMKAELTPDRLNLYRNAYEERIQKIKASEDLPAESPYELKLPLERAVQILKRYRDVFFFDKPALATQSIILTTLAAEAYQGQLSIYETIDGIITHIEQKARSWNGQPRPFQVPNPANPAENFSEKWFEEEGLFSAFVAFVKQLHQTWQQLKTTATQATKDNLLENVFGDLRIKRILNEQIEYRNKVEKAQKLQTYPQLANSSTLFTTANVKLSQKPTPVPNQQHRNFGGTALPLKVSRFSAGTNFLQKQLIERTYPGIFKCQVRNGVLVCNGKIKPTDECEEYRIQIHYAPGHPPEVFINSHLIKPRKSIHMYSNGALCLHYPPDIKWKHRTSIAHYTIPWIAEWIVCYELWKITGKWSGAEVIH
jgi:hypothetical protein